MALSSVVQVCLRYIHIDTHPRLLVVSKVYVREMLRYRSDMVVEHPGKDPENRRKAGQKSPGFAEPQPGIRV